MIAQRALNIVTRSLQGHVYTNAGGNKSRWLTDQWQMLYPHPSASCFPFGINPEHSFLLGASKGKFVWQVWRRYDCCVKNPGAILIAKIKSPVVPPNCLY